MNENKKFLAAYVEPELALEIEQLAKREERTVSALIRILLREFVARKKSEQK